MIKAIILSYNRACQLHLLLESLNRNAPGVFDPTVIYRTEVGPHATAYEIVKKRFPNANFIEQKPPVVNMFNLVWEETRKADKLVSYFVDDNVMFRPLIKLDLVEKYANAPNVIGFSTRLGRNITHDGPLSSKVLRRPEFTGCNDEDFMHFSLREGADVSSSDNMGIKWASKIGHFGWPFSVDGNICRKEVVLKYADRVDWKSPSRSVNDIEGEIVQQISADLGVCPDRYVCYEHSIVTNIVLNRVSARSHTKIGTNKADIASLAKAYNRGQILDYDSIDTCDIHQCHVDLPIGFTEWK